MPAASDRRLVSPTAVLREPGDGPAEELLARGGSRRQAPADGRPVERLGLLLHVVLGRPPDEEARHRRQDPGPPRCRGRSSSCRRGSGRSSWVPTESIPGALDSQVNDRPGTTSVIRHTAAGSFGCSTRYSAPTSSTRSGSRAVTASTVGSQAGPAADVGHHRPQALGGGGRTNGRPRSCTEWYTHPRSLASREASRPRGRARRGSGPPVPWTPADPPRAAPRETARHGLVARPGADHRPGRQRPLPFRAAALLAGCGGPPRESSASAPATSTVVATRPTSTTAAATVERLLTYGDPYHGRRPRRRHRPPRRLPAAGHDLPVGLQGHRHRAQLRARRPPRRARHRVSLADRRAPTDARGRRRRSSTTG